MALESLSKYVLNMSIIFPTYSKYMYTYKHTQVMDTNNQTKCGVVVWVAVTVAAAVGASIPWTDYTWFEINQLRKSINKDSTRELQTIKGFNPGILLQWYVQAVQITVHQQNDETQGLTQSGWWVQDRLWKEIAAECNLDHLPNAANCQVQLGPVWLNFIHELQDQEWATK